MPSVGSFAGSEARQSADAGLSGTGLGKLHRPPVIATDPLGNCSRGGRKKRWACAPCFVSALAFSEGTALADESKLAILVGSALSAAGGIYVLSRSNTSS